MDNKSLPIQTDKDSKVKLPENYTTTDPTEKLAIDLINGKEVQWVAFSNTDGIAIDFIIQDDGIFLMRFETEIPYPLDTVVTSFCDNTIRKQWDTQISDKNKVFDKRTEGNIEYEKIYHYTKLPFMISDREILAERKIVNSYAGDSKRTLVTLHSIEDPSYPIKSNPVRTTMYVNSFYFEANGDKSTKLISVRKWNMHFAGPMLKMMKRKGGPGAEAVKTMIDGIKKGCEMVLESKK